MKNTNYNTANGLRIAIIDADLIGRKRHRFPNLACMKLSGYWKDKNAEVKLKTDYENIELFDMVYVSKMFTDTPIDESVLNLNNVKYGGDKSKFYPGYLNL